MMAARLREGFRRTGWVERYKHTFATGQKTLDWHEEDHPRDADGKFGSGGGAAVADRPKKTSRGPVDIFSPEFEELAEQEAKTKTSHSKTHDDYVVAARKSRKDNAADISRFRQLARDGEVIALTEVRKIAARQRDLSDDMAKIVTEAPDRAAAEEALQYVVFAPVLDKQKADVRRELETTLKRSSTKALELYARHIGTVDYFESPHELEDATGRRGRTGRRGVIHGSYAHVRPEDINSVKAPFGHLSLDGPFTLPKQYRGKTFSGSGPDGVISRGKFWAHELGHVFDHYGDYSGDYEWGSIHKEEFADGQLTAYGAIEPGESFAEFYRVVLDRDDPSWLRKYYPKAYAYFEEIGAIDA